MAKDFDKSTRKPDCESLGENTSHKDSLAYRNESYPGGLGSKTVDTESVAAKK